MRDDRMSEAELSALLGKMKQAVRDLAELQEAIDALYGSQLRELHERIAQMEVAINLVFPMISGRVIMLRQAGEHVAADGWQWAADTLMAAIKSTGKRHDKEANDA